MKRLLDRLGIVGLIIGIAIWGCVAMLLGASFVMRFIQGFVVVPPSMPLAGLSCPLTLSSGEAKTITATIANPQSDEQTYPVTMAWISLESNGQRTEFCDQEVTVQPGSEEAVSCLVRPDDLGPGSSYQSWYISVIAVKQGYDYHSYSNPEKVLTGNCVIRSESRFWIEVGYGAGVTLTALAAIFWGVVLWRRGKRVNRILIVVLSIMVYGAAWWMNSMVWLGLSNLNLYFLILGSMLLVMYMVLWLAS